MMAPKNTKNRGIVNFRFSPLIKIAFEIIRSVLYFAITYLCNLYSTLFSTCYVGVSSLI